MKIPHDFVEGGVQHIMVFDLVTEEQTDTDIIPICDVCCYPEGHFNHRAPENLPALLGELFDFVVDNVMIGKVHAPPNELLKRVSKVLSR